jgi:GNAT superfamily N-acetyltransferase
MPATLDDPAAPLIMRSSGDGGPYATPGGPLPVGIAPSQVTLRDRVTTATIIPFSAPNQVPLTLLTYLCDQLGREIEKGDTYPMVEPLPLESFGPYWFGIFGAVMLLGEIEDGRALHEMARQGCDWERECLGSFYIKPNYPGRSSHVCNGGFLVTDASRNRGVGRLMGESYLDWAPKLGYTYSVFNLVYETNLASCRIWDALGFKRIGRVKECGNLKSHPGELIDAIIRRALRQDPLLPQKWKVSQRRRQSGEEPPSQRRNPLQTNACYGQRGGEALAQGQRGHIGYSTPVRDRERRAPQGARRHQQDHRRHRRVVPLGAHQRDSQPSDPQLSRVQ